MARSRKKRRKNATMTVHGADARAAVAAISDIARLEEDPEYGSQRRSFEDVAVALDRAMKGEPVFDAEESREALKDYAGNTVRREYYQDITRAARDILVDAANEFDSYDEARDWIYERIWEDADGSGYVLYTAQNLKVLVASDNWLAIEDVANEGIVGEADLANFTSIMQQAAFFAVRADLTEAVDRDADEVAWREDQEDEDDEIEDNPRSRKLKASLLR